MADFRIQQVSHGFERLTGVVREATSWRRCSPSERPDGVVSRVLGPDAVQISTTLVTNLSGLTPGSVYGMDATGNLTANSGAGSWGKAVSNSDIALYLAQGDGTSTQVIAPASIDTSGFEQTSQKGVAGGYAPLNPSGLVPDEHLPNIADEAEAAGTAALHVGGHERKLNPHPQYITTVQAVLFSRFFGM